MIYDFYSIFYVTQSLRGRRELRLWIGVDERGHLSGTVHSQNCNEWPAAAPMKEHSRPIVLSMESGERDPESNARNQV